MDGWTSVTASEGLHLVSVALRLSTHKALGVNMYCEKVNKCNTLHCFQNSTVRRGSHSSSSLFTLKVANALCAETFETAWDMALLNTQSWSYTSGTGREDLRRDEKGNFGKNFFTQCENKSVGPLALCWIIRFLQWQGYKNGFLL
jgi:hypothetical protein